MDKVREIRIRKNISGYHAAAVVSELGDDDPKLSAHSDDPITALKNLKTRMRRQRLDWRRARIKTDVDSIEVATIKQELGEAVLREDVIDMLSDMDDKLHAAYDKFMPDDVKRQMRNLSQAIERVKDAGGRGLNVLTAPLDALYDRYMAWLNADKSEDPIGDTGLLRVTTRDPQGFADYLRRAVRSVTQFESLREDDDWKKRVAKADPDFANRMGVSEEEPPTMEAFLKLFD